MTSAGQPASVRAAMNYGGIAHRRAKAAIEALIAAHVVERTRGGTKPRYRLTASDAGTPDWIWLPNALITGAAGETPPVQRVRQTQDAMTLRLLVDCYSAQDLTDDGGIGRQHMWQAYKRVRLGERGQYVVWGFSEASGWVGWRAALTWVHYHEVTNAEKKRGMEPGVDFFARQHQLTDLGLIEWVPSLFEADKADAEMIHPCGHGGTDSIEDRLSAAAHGAGMALLTDWQAQRAEDENLIVVPVPRHLPNVAMIGVARLRYRPQTRKTAAWWVELHTKAEGFLRGYEQIAAGITRRAASA